MDFLELAGDRYSCRCMSDRAVEPEKIEKIVEAGLLAPTAVNRQPVRIWILESPEAREMAAQVSRTFNARTFLVVGGRAEDAWVREYDGRNFADVDATIVATHMLMEIQQLGLATTWVGHFDAPKLKTLCPQMEGWDLIALFPVGYAAGNDAAKPSPRHAQRKSAQELTERL